MHINFGWKCLQNGHFKSTEIQPSWADGGVRNWAARPSHRSCISWKWPSSTSRSWSSRESGRFLPSKSSQRSSTLSGLGSLWSHCKLEQFKRIIVHSYTSATSFLFFSSDLILSSTLAPSERSFSCLRHSSTTLSFFRTWNEIFPKSKYETDKKIINLKKQKNDSKTSLRERTVPRIPLKREKYGVSFKKDYKNINKNHLL